MKTLLFAPDKIGAGLCSLVFVAVAFMRPISLFGLINQTTTEEKYLQVPSVIHVHSNFSDGKHSIEEIALQAQEKGVKVVIFSDHDLMRWEYGLWPLGNILKKKVEKNSILRVGSRKYLQGIEEVQKKYPEILLLPGIESAPFYYWWGKHFKHHLTLHNWHKHLLIAGLSHPEDYENLPLVSNLNAGVRSFRSVVLFWPVLLLALGSWFLVKKKERQVVFGRQVLITHFSAHKILGTVVILIGLLFLTNNYPYKYFPYDQYHGDRGVEPYQNLINYVNAKGGVIFWAHPEAPNWEKPQEIDGIMLQTPTYPEDLMKTKNYTGFAVLYEGYKKVGTPGGIWDQILKQYCTGVREKPVWAIGELDYKSEGYLGTSLDSIQNILLIPTNLHRSKQESRIDTNTKEVLDCLRKGRFYVAQKTKDYILKLEEFKVETEEGIAMMGEEIGSSKFPKIKIKIHPVRSSGKITDTTRELAYYPDSSKTSNGVKIKLIRGGEIVKIFEEVVPFEIEYLDTGVPREKTYYRLDIVGAKGERILTNPIFLSPHPTLSLSEAPTSRRGSESSDKGRGQR